MVTSVTSQPFVFLQHRDRQPEIMDQPGLDEVEHRLALQGIRRVNMISGGVPALWRDLCSLAVGCTADQPLRVLDVACGGGDVVLRLSRKARRYGMPIRFEGCDVSETALRVARAAADQSPHLKSELRFFQHDALTAPFPEEYDVLMCSLFLHHLAEADAMLLLQKMQMAAQKAVLVDDLLRTRLGYVLCWVGCRILTRSSMVHTDGPLSVRAAFSIGEIRELANRAGLYGAQFREHWPERFLMSWQRH